MAKAKAAFNTEGQLQKLIEKPLAKQKRSTRRQDRLKATKHQCGEIEEKQAVSRTLSRSSGWHDIA